MELEIKSYLEKIIDEYSKGVRSVDSWLDLINYTKNFKEYCTSKGIKIDKLQEFELKCIINDIRGYNEIFEEDTSEINQSWYHTVEQCGTDFSCLVSSILNKNTTL